MNGTDSNTSGTNVATLDFIPAVPGDLVGDKQMQEIIRRLQVTFEGREDSDIWSGVDEPTDQTLIWWPKDPTSGTRIGRPKTYDSTLGEWVELGSGLELPEFNRFVVGNAAVAAGNPNINVDFNGWGHTNYHVTLTFTTKTGNDYQAAPAAGSMNNFAYVITNHANNQFTIGFYNVPAGGIGFMWKVEEVKSDRV